MAAVAPSAEPLQLAQRIQCFAEGSDDPFTLLSLAPGLPAVTLATPVPDLRSNYRKLAAMIHPDRLKKVYEHATEAFQKLVRVFENVNDPSYRAKLAPKATPAAKKVAAAAAKVDKPKKEAKAKVSAAEKAAKKVAKAAEKKTKKAAATATAKKGAKRARGGDDDDEDFIESDEDDSDSSSDDDSSDDSSDDDEDDELLLGSTAAAKKAAKAKAATAAPVADEFGMKARAARDNTGCYRTPVKCPNCSDLWVPDDARHYVMLMCYGVRVFCNTCLLQFGPATAVHLCPCCKGPANYDISLFDKKVKCPNTKCGKTYGFSSVAVTDKHLADVREKLRAEAEKRARDEDRARRAAARSGGGLDTSTSSAPSGGGGAVDAAALDENIGQAMVTGSCPICEKRVGMKAAREHVTQCMANPPKKRRAPACVIVGEAAERKKEAAAAAKKKKAEAAKAKKSSGVTAKKAAAPAAKKTAPKKKKPAAKKGGKKGGDDSDSSVYDSDSDASSYASSSD